MKRREFIALLGGAGTLPVCARAEGVQLRRIAVLVAIAENDPEAPRRISALRGGLQERGWVNNIHLETRFSAGSGERLRAYAAELVELKPDIIFAGNTTALGALHRETRSIPIVFAQVEDPVAGGFVASLARPGGNITGFTNFEETFPIKWLELLKQLAPNVSRVAFIYDPGNVTGPRSLAIIRSGAPSIGVEVTGAAVRDAAGIQEAIDTLASRPNGGILVLGGAATATHRDLIITSAAHRRLPAVYPYRYFVTSGGLASYGVDTVALYRQSASYIDRILKGERPAELPVQQPTKFEIVINLKIANALNLKISPAVLARADEVIE